MFDALIFGIKISVTIVILNAVMQEIITRCVSNIGYDSYTIESAKVKFYVFLILYFNTGIIMLFVGANLEHSLPLIGQYFDG